jgi:hypothetical protein
MLEAERAASVVDVEGFVAGTGVGHDPAPGHSQGESAPKILYRLQMSDFIQLGPIGVRGDIHQRSDQPQQRLLLRPRPLSQEGPDFNVRQTASGRRVGLVDNECVPVRGLPTKKPRIAVWAAV